MPEQDDACLYRVTCRGMHDRHGIAYVVATGPSEAYAKVRYYLDAHNLGFGRERELDKVELLADTDMYGDCGTRLYL